MKPTLLGYFPKQRYPPPPWMVEQGISEIASVSLCIAEGPDGWLEQWKHNEWGFFRDPDTAWSVVPQEERSDFRLHAYSLYPAEFWEGEEGRVELPDLGVAPLDAGFQSVGWDVASRSAGQHLECSPLSCNLLAEELEANAFCLFSDLAVARAFALKADDFRCEPGPYFVVEVWRRDM